MATGTTAAGRVVVVGLDERLSAAALERSGTGVTVDRGGSADAVRDGLDGCECVVVGDHLDGADSVEFVETVRESNPDLPVVFAPTDGSESLASRAVAAGATAYVPWDGGDAGDVAAAVASAVEEYRETQTRRRERAFHEAAQRANPSSVIVIDAEGEFVWGNGRARERLGIAEQNGEYVVGETDVYDADGEFVPREQRPYLEVFDTGDPVQDWECQMDLTVGRRWLSLSAAPLDEASSDVEFVVVTAEDITERKRYEQRLERRRDDLESELSEVFERVSDAFFALDEDWQFTYLNERAEELIDVSEPKVVGERIWDVFPEAVDTRFEAEYRRAMETQEPVAFEEHYPPLDSWFAVRAYPSETGLSVYFRDVSERVVFEERLNALHEVSRSLFAAREEEEVAERLVEAGLSVLDLPAAAVYRREGDVLHCDARALDPSLPDDELPQQMLVDGSITGRAVREGETLHYDDVRSVDDLAVDAGATQLRSALFVPIGDHGTLTVASPRVGAFDDQTRRLVEVMAANASAAHDRVDRERALHRRGERLAAINDLNSLVQSVAGAVVRQSTRGEIAQLVCDRLAASDSYRFAWLADPGEDDESPVVAAQSGVESVDGDATLGGPEAARGPTGLAVRTREMQIVTDVRTDERYEGLRDHAETYGYRSSAAVPITLEDELYGVLNVYADREGAFGEEERTALGRLGTIIAHAVRSVERERRYRTLVENLPNGGVTLVDRDMVVQLAAGENYDHLEVSPDDVVGKHVSEVEFVPENVLDQLRDAYEVALDGQVTNREIEFRDRVVEFRTVPVVEDGEVYGAMSLSQDVTERTRRAEELEHERERLEFLNRLIRHNLLNSLNVVDARLQVVDGHVDYEVQTHLDTARERTNEMTDLVETIRALMRAVVAGQEHDLETVELPTVLLSEVNLARDAFPEAEFEVSEMPTVSVVADDLLSEVFENLLTNAVQHNDSETPRVDVDVEADGETVTVVVADNGPGIPPDLEASIFEKGTKGFASPGTGFGLHIVREIVDAYGGDVEVTNTDTGAVFEVTLPRA